MPRTFARTAAVVVWSMLLTTAASDVPGYRGAGLLLRQGLTAVALQLCHLSPMTSFWSYPAEARLWLEVASCESSALGPCVLPPHFDPDLNDTSHSTIEVVQNEDLMVSWYMTAGNGSTRSFAQMFKTPCTGIQCASDDSSGDSSGCTATLIGRHSFVEDQCAGRGQENCTGSAMPCLWDAANELCEPTINATANYSGQIVLKAPSELGIHSFRLYDQVECAAPRACAEVTEEKPDTIVVNGTMVGDATSAEMRTAIAQIVNEEEANVEVLLYPCTGGQSDCFTLQATVMPSTSNATEQAAMVAALQNSATFAQAVTDVVDSSFSFHAAQTTIVAVAQLGAAPCWEIKQTIEFNVNAPVCAQVCPHGNCTLTDTCVCEHGWAHNDPVLDCNRPLCAAVELPGCGDGCCNNGNCTAPGICTCAAGWGGSDCTVSVCPPTWSSVFDPTTAYEGSACENGGVCLDSHVCNCTDAWKGAGCQLDANECNATWLQTPPCSDNSICHNFDGGYLCTCDNHYVGDGVRCHPEANITVKIFAPAWDASEIIARTINDVANAVSVPNSTIQAIGETSSSAVTFVSMAFQLVPSQPWLTPTMLASQLMAAIVNSSDGTIGPNLLSFDPVYGVSVSTFQPVPTTTFHSVINLTLNGDWDPLLQQNGSVVRTQFIAQFQASVSSLLSIVPKRVHVVEIIQGSIVVSFSILEPSASVTAEPSTSTASALIGFRHRMLSCSTDSSECPVFAGLPGVGFTEQQTALQVPVSVDESLFLGPADIQCYSSEDPRCNSTAACETDADCKLLQGLGDPAGAYCLDSFCEDGLGSVLLLQESTALCVAPVFCLLSVLPVLLWSQ